MNRNGKVFHWCAHCGNWSTTHGTNGHTNTKTLKPPAPAANFCTPCLDDGAWAMMARFPSPLPSARPSPGPSLLLPPMGWVLLGISLGLLLQSLDLASWLSSIWPTLVGHSISTYRHFCSGSVLGYAAVLDFSSLCHAFLSAHWDVLLSSGLLALFCGYVVHFLWMTFYYPCSAPRSPRWRRRGHAWPPDRRRSQRWSPSSAPPRPPSSRFLPHLSWNLRRLRSRDPRASLHHLLWDAGLVCLDMLLGWFYGFQYLWMGGDHTPTGNPIAWILPFAVGNLAPSSKQVSPTFFALETTRCGLAPNSSIVGHLAIPAQDAAFLWLG